MNVRLGRSRWASLAFALCLVSLASILGAHWANATGTPAGTSISNQAVVTFKNSGGTDQPAVTSNVVTTTVAQAYGVDVFTANTPQNVLPGTIVYYPITVTNTGNGQDNYDLTATGTEGAWTRTIYLDSNGNGVVDPGEPIVASTGTINADQSKKFVVAVSVPGSASNGTTDTMTVTATGVAPAPASDTASVTDVTNVTTGAVITGSKAATPATIDPLAAAAASRTVTYTVNVTNTGGSGATAVVVEDTLPASPAGLLFAGAGTASSGTVEYYNSQTTAYEAYNAANLAKYTKIRLTLGTLAVSASASLSFQAVVPEGAAPGGLNNTAYLSATGLATVPTNTTTTTVQQTAAVALSAATGKSTVAGGTVTYAHTVTNSGNGEDVFNLKPTTVPSGWIVQIFNADGVTPLGDTNGDGIPDTGRLAATGTRDIVVRVTAPSTATPAAYDVVVEARSIYDPSVAANRTDTTTITANPTVTLTKTVSTTTPQPGDTLTYTVGYSVANASSYVTVIQDAIPTGTSLVAGTISNGGTVDGGLITWNLGTLAAGSTGTLTFDVKVNSDAAVGTKINNTATVSYQNAAGTPMTSGSAAAPEATVAAKAGVLLTPNNTGNAVPGTTLFYGHTLANTGNSSDNITVTTTSPNGWPYTVFVDSDGDGVLDPGEPQLTAALTVPAGESRKLLVRVQVPSGTTTGTVDNATITATSGVNAATKSSAQDTTTVVAANAPIIQVSKTGVVDTSAGAYTGPDGVAYNNSDGVPRPGATIIYTVAYSNNGTGSATTVVIKDNVPANTTLVAASITGGGTETGGAITWNIGTVAPSASGSVSFKVTIN